MHDGWGIFISSIGVVITVLLSIIGYLISKGVDRILSEIRLIWEWITKDTEKTGKFNAQIEAMNARCAERHPLHPGGRRDYDPIVRGITPGSDET